MLLEEKIIPAGPILIKEGGFIVKTMEDEGDKIQAYRLRHKIFCEDLEWAPKTDDRLEIDAYDSHAVFFGVFDAENGLSAFLRLILPEMPFMLEKEFISMVGPEHKIKKEKDTVEVSRLCVAPEARSNRITGNFGAHSISMLLYKGVYHWCLRHNIRYLYLVVEHKIFRLLQAKGYPCKLLGEPVLMPDGVIAVAAIVDWRVFESLNMSRKPGMFRWFTQYQSDLVQGQLQPHDFYLQY